MSTTQKDFAQSLKELLAQKKVSASELARMMAYKSRNSIFRILDGAGAHGARLAFFSRLKEENPLELSEDEFMQLEEALEISRVGLETYGSNAAMRELIAGAEAEMAKARVIMRDGRSAKPQLKNILDSKNLVIAITGCCDRRMMSALSAQLAQRTQKGGVQVAHFISMGPGEIVHVLNAIQPILFADYYTAYCVEPGVFTKEREQLYRSNCAYVCWQDEQGVWHDQPLLLVDKDLFYALRGSKASEYSALRTLFEDDTQKLKKLKNTFFNGETPDYVAYTEACRKLEQGRAIYTVKLDVPFPFIDTEILVPCAEESFEAAGIKREAVREIIEPLREVHVRRYENIFSKHKPTHTIFSHEYMEMFARTGRQTDHFFALRPYTSAERTAILTNIRDQARDNPNFHVYFFKDGFESLKTEIALYEGAGTLVTKSFTDYNLQDGHEETIITDAEFCARYKAFFTEDLLAQRVMSEEETMAVLDELIEIAKKS